MHKAMEVIISNYRIMFETFKRNRYLKGIYEQECCMGMVKGMIYYQKPDITQLI